MRALWPCLSYKYFPLVLYRPGTIKGQHLLDYADLGDVGFAMRVIGRSAGRTTIGISFSCDFSSTGNNLQPVFYSVFDTIAVAPDLPLALGVPITWFLPPFYTASNVLPE